MEKLRVIQVGTGPMVHAAHLARAMKLLSDTYQLEAIVEENDALRARAMKMEEYADLPFISWEEAVKRHPDAIMVEEDEHRLVPSAIRALEKDFPVYMDKPGSENCQDFHRMCDLAKAKGLPLSLGYMYRENPAVKYAKKLMQEGKLGEILSVEAQMSVSSGTEYRKTLSRFQGGMLYYLGCHLIDLVVSFCGFPQEVIPLNSRSGMDGVDCVDIGFCVYRYPHGTSFVKSTATEINGVFRRSLIISGTKGTFEIRPMEVGLPGKENWNDTYAWETLDNDAPWQDHRVEVKFPKQRRYDGLLLNFAKYVRGEAVNPYSYDYEAKLHDLIMQSCQ